MGNVRLLRFPSAPLGNLNSNRPLILYTDIVDGPISGGENNKGCYLSIFGLNLGSFADWGVSSHVYIGGAEVDNYRCLQNAVGYSIYTSPLAVAGEGVYELWGIKRIVVQVGALGSPTIGTALPITLSVKGATPLNSTSGGFMLDLDGNQISFTPVNGRILFVSLTGTNQASYGTNPLSTEGTFASPLRNVQVYNGSSFSGAIWGTGSALGITTTNAVGPGTHVYMRGGEYGSDSNGGLNGTLVDFFGRTGNPPSSASQSGSIVVASYPGAAGANSPELVTITIPGGNGGGFNFCDTQRSSLATPWGETGYCHYITIANLFIRGPDTSVSVAAAGGGAPINWEVHALGCRAVNNELVFPLQSGNPTAGGIAGHGTLSRRLGNYVHDIYDPSGNLQNHCFYIGNNTSTTNPAATGELNSITAYNFACRIKGGQGVMMRGPGQTETTPYCTVHHNWFQGIGKFAVEIGVQGDTYNRIRATVYCNVVIGEAFTSAGTTGTQAAFAQASDAIATANGVYFGYNTFFGVITHYAAVYCNGGAFTGGGSIGYENNIIRVTATNGTNFGNLLIYNANAAVQNLAGNNWTDVTGTSPNPSDATGTFVDPLLVSTASPYDAHPSASSTMPNKGNTPALYAPITLPPYDFFFNPRPQGANAKWAIGAVERVGG